MNYHNFASRLSVRRIPALSGVKDPTKPEPKKPRRPVRRRCAIIAALVMMTCLLALRVEAAEPDSANVAVKPAWQVNLLTLMVTFTGLSVVLLRLPTLWRRNLDC